MKRIRSLYLGFMLAILMSLPILANASEVYQPDVDYEVGKTPVVDLSVDNTMYQVPMDTNGEVDTKNGPIYWTWKITKKEVAGHGIELPLRNGPTGRGPGTLSINDSKSINRSYTNTLSGEYPIGKANIAASLGVTIGTSELYGTEYSIPLEKNEVKTIKYAPKYITYKITQAEYINGITPTGDTKVAYVNVFDNWFYDWVLGQ